MDPVGTHGAELQTAGINPVNPWVSTIDINLKTGSFRDVTAKRTAVVVLPNGVRFDPQCHSANNTNFRQNPLGRHLIVLSDCSFRDKEVQPVEIISIIDATVIRAEPGFIRSMRQPYLMSYKIVVIFSLPLL